MAREIQVALLTFGRRHEQELLSLVREGLGRAFPGARLRVVVVDNRLGGRVEIQLDAGADRISGDNRSREFSGWERGLAWLESASASSPETMMVLANDTLVRPDKIDRIRTLSADQVAAAERGAVVGWVDAYPRPVRSFGLELRQWVDTSLVIARRAVLERLRPLALPFRDDEVFTRDARLFREPSPLSENYRAYLRTWLFGETADPEFAHAWHAQGPLTVERLGDVQGKIRAILCEHHLSARARSMGIALSDIRDQPLAIDPWRAADTRPSA
jgi:hypothetical protein